MYVCYVIYYGFFFIIPFHNNKIKQNMSIILNQNITTVLVVNSFLTVNKMNQYIPINNFQYELSKIYIK